MRATCSKCGKRKPAKMFPPNRHKANGLSSWCRDCSRASSQAWRDKSGYNERWRDERRRIAEERRRQSLEELRASNARLREQSRRSRKAA